MSSTRFVLVSSGANPYLTYFQQHNYPKVFSGDGISIFENINALGTATLASSLLLAEQLPKDNSFNPHLQATTTDATLLAHAKELGIAVLDHVDPKPSAVHGTATVSSYHHTEIIIATAADSASILALSEVWHPDWKATIDDQPAYIGRINEAFRGIALPAGHHRVRVYYDNKAVVHGKLTSLITLGMLVLAACIARYRQQARLQLP